MLVWVSFHVTPIKEYFSTFHVGDHGNLYLANNHACSIEGIGTKHFSMDGSNELVLHDVGHAPCIKKSLLLFGKWIWMDIVLSLKEVMEAH
ncbi:hypothetical protein KP509_35G056800 [Ceratopteris richardii]|uniref:Retrovirus-related Pol polyprotein from transposon TNT 1-94-like beta-barrel domain-containing protein n=1 Tax=Ceratopteris richardii TaxID=49495 RepID=A0A8T2QHX4_CERRI|nr:hypothetical protein KP509_35G056800 [Ceratopteris richardii]